MANKTSFLREFGSLLFAFTSQLCFPAMIRYGSLFHEIDFVNCVNRILQVHKQLLLAHSYLVFNILHFSLLRTFLLFALQFPDLLHLVFISRAAHCFIYNFSYKCGEFLCAESSYSKCNKKMADVPNCLILAVLPV